MATITNGMRSIHPGEYFGTSAEFWMGLQSDFDVATARTTMVDALARIVCRETVGEPTYA